MLLSYARVSTTRQDGDEKFSVPDQLRKNRAVAQMRNIDKFDVVEYVDSGISGALPLTKRPEGGRLWTEMKPGDIAVAAKLDRMFRSASDALSMLERFREHKVKVILLDLGSDPIGETAISEAIFGLLAIFANLERRMIRERTDIGRVGKRLAGGYTGGRAAPYGWRVQGEGKSAVLVPDQTEQKVVELVCRRVGQGKTWGQVILELNMSGYRTRAGREFTLTGKEAQRIYEYETKRRAWNKVAA
jgi:putative DNA-invertase from lambdoid prophage Rac